MLPVRPICDGDGDFFSPPIHIEICLSSPIYPLQRRHVSPLPISLSLFVSLSFLFVASCFRRVIWSFL